MGAILALCLGLGATPAAGAAPGEAFPPLVLVRATASAPNAAERNYAASVTRRLDAWLAESGIPTRTVTDEESAGNGLAGARVAILGYNPDPSPAQLAALRAFTRRGGRLLVFYSSGPGLADLMGMRLGAYQACPEGERWARIRFEDQVPPDFPRAIRQVSRNIRPVTPAARDVRIVATWRNASDGGPGEPAVLLGPNGAWVTHVLLDDGDTWNKRRLLLALAARHEPGVWPCAARHAAEARRPFHPYDTFEAAVAGLRAGLPPGRAGGRAYEWLEAARLRNAAVADLVRARRPVEAIEAALAADDLLAAAAAAADSPAPDEIRAVWDHTGHGLYPRDWARACRELKALGVTDLLSNMAWAGTAHYASAVLPPSDVMRRLGDQMEQAVPAARAAGIRLHVWKVCWFLGKAPPDWVARLRAEGRLQVSASGAALDWLCPSHDDNLRHEKDAIRELVRRWDVAGVHLDYIRYPASDACYCAGCRGRFEAARGRPVARWPDDCRFGPDRVEYARWRRDRISRLVRDVRAILRKERPGARLSAAVFGRYPLCADSVGQDWGAWIKAGDLDFVCPMNYSTDPKAYQSLVEAQKSALGGASRLCPGIGVTAAESRLNALQTAAQIRAVRAAGCAGFALFDLNPVLRDEVLKVLNPSKP